MLAAENRRHSTPWLTAKAGADRSYRVRRWHLQGPRAQVPLQLVRV